MAGFWEWWHAISDPKEYAADRMKGAESDLWQKHETEIKEKWPDLYDQHEALDSRYWATRKIKDYMVYLKIGVWVFAIVVGFFFFKNVIIALFSPSREIETYASTYAKQGR